MPYSEVSFVYKDPLTIQKLNQMDDNSVFTSEHKIIGGEVSITGTSTVEVSPLRVEIEGKWLLETTTANLVLTAENNAHWREGTTQEATSTAFYVYAYNSNSTVAIKFGLSAPAYTDTNSSTSLGVKMYDKSGSVWFRCIGSVWNDTGADAGDLRKYQQVGHRIQYHFPINVASAAAANWTVVDCSGPIPQISRRGIFGIESTHGGADPASIHIRPSDTSGWVGTGVTTNTGQALGCVAQVRVGGQRETTLNDRQIDYQIGAGDTTGAVYVEGYYMDIR